jgi:hypothetical protein
MGGGTARLSRVASSNGDSGSVLDSEMIRTHRGEVDVWNGGGGARGAHGTFYRARVARR